MEDYVVPMEEGGDRQISEPGKQAVTTDLQDKTIIVHLVKPVESKPQQVSFRLEYTSNDGKIKDLKEVSLPYDPNGNSYDLWSYIQDSKIYKGYQADQYFMRSFVVHHGDGDKTYTDAGQFTVTPALAGQTVTVVLDRKAVSTKKTVDFTVEYKSNDGVLDATKQVSAQYDPEGVLTDLWDYLAESGTVKNAVKSGYTFQNYMLDKKTVTTHGVQAVNGDLAGKTVKSSATGRGTTSPSRCPSGCTSRATTAPSRRIRTCRFPTKPTACTTTCGTSSWAPTATRPTKRPGTP